MAAGFLLETIMMKTCLFILYALLLTACIPDPVEMEERAPPIAPRAVLPSAPAEARLYNAAGMRLPNEMQTRYFNSLGQPVRKAVKNGYYRKIIGKMPTGHWIVQDFYQNNNQPYTSPFVAVAETQLNAFYDHIYHSRTAWFSENGAIELVADYADGEPQGKMWFFHNNKPYLYINSTPNKIDTQMQFLDEQGNVFASTQQHKKQYSIMLFYPNGTAMLQIQGSPEQNTRMAWNTQGKTVLPNEVNQKSRVLSEKIRLSIQNIQHNNKELLAILESIE